MEPDGPEVIPCSVPAAAGSRLHFSWGCGTQLRLVELASPATGAGGEDPYGAVCEWYGHTEQQQQGRLARGWRTAAEGRQQRQQHVDACIAAAPCRSAPDVEQRRIAYDIAPLFSQLRRRLQRLGPTQDQEQRQALREYSAGVLAVLTSAAG